MSDSTSERKAKFELSGESVKSPKDGGRQDLPPAALRALAEAHERRSRAEAARQAAEKAQPLPQAELGGRNGPDPIRYGDWEKNGIISDF